MEKITLFIETNLNLYLLLIIVLGGVFIVKYTKGIKWIQNTHKVLIASIIFSSLFYFVNDCKSECFKQYLFTYLFATSFYELIVKLILKKIQKALGSSNKNPAFKSK